MFEMMRVMEKMYGPPNKQYGNDYKNFDDKDYKMPVQPRFRFKRQASGNTRPTDLTKPAQDLNRGDRLTKSTQVTVLVSQSPQSSQISVLAVEISSVTSSVTCSDAEKTSITTQISEVESAISMISDALEAVQEQIKTLTGSTASVSVAETTTMSTKAPSSSAS